MKNLNRLTKVEIVNIFIKINRNSGVTIDNLSWREDGRLEWICSHNIGHTVFSPDRYFTHGCDGCCKQIYIPEDWKEKDEE
uniref:Uncharacterized protein n=1 Tax=viral metagenome TaxID=1070528 RepID=A0A6C0EPE4_9ZZZZ